MKTVKELAESFIEAGWWRQIYTQKYRLKYAFEKGFESGVYRTNRFIPFSEEEPPENETFLVSLFNGNVFTAKYIKSSNCKEDDMWHDGFSFYLVKDTCWRKI